MEHLKDLNLKYNPVCKQATYYSKIQEKATNLQILDDETIGESPDDFYATRL